MDNPIEFSMTDEDLKSRISWCIAWPDTGGFEVVGAYAELLRRSNIRIRILEIELVDERLGKI